MVVVYQRSVMALTQKVPFFFRLFELECQCASMCVYVYKNKLKFKHLKCSHIPSSMSYTSRPLKRQHADTIVNQNIPKNLWLLLCWDANKLCSNNNINCDFFQIPRWWKWWGIVQPFLKDAYSIFRTSKNDKIWGVKKRMTNKCITILRLLWAILDIFSTEMFRI